MTIPTPPPPQPYAAPLPAPLPAPEEEGPAWKPTRSKRVHTPTVLQMEAVECGAASLAMIMAYHGLTVPLEEMRQACGVSRDGSKASYMVKAATRYGMIAKGFKKEPRDLEALTLPMVVFWNFNHFVVLEGFGRDRVYLNDPATGPREVTADEFDQGFTGVVLTFTPGPDFKKGGEKPGLIPALARRLEGSTSGLAFVILAGVFLVLPGLVIPSFARMFVDDILVANMQSWLLPLLIAMGATACLRAALVWLQQTWLLRLETRLALTTSSKFLWHVLRLPVDFYAQRFGGEIASRVGINDQVAQLLSGQLATTVLSTLTVVFYAFLMLRYDVLLTLIGVVIAMLNIVALKVVSRKRADANRRVLQEQGKMMGTAMGGLQIIETLKATGSEGDFFARWAGYQAKVVNATQELAVYSRVLQIIPSLLNVVNTLAILGLGAMRVMDGAMTMGMLVAFQSLMASFTGPIGQLVGLGGTLQTVEGGMSRLDDVLRYPVDTNLAPAPPPTAGADGMARTVPSYVGKLSGSLELRDISFGYNRLEAPLIENFSLKLGPGSRVALVGGSGSGKSTISRIVTGLYQPWSGEVLFDGMPRRALSRNLLCNSLSLVDQDIFLFEGTIRENLTMWDLDVGEGHIVRAASDACIHEDISARHGGYDSPLAEGGGNFSGGQRQRLEIARALVGNPSILVLDEATSALDSVTEKEIDDNLRRRGCTCLIVAHRLSTIRDCDEIIVLSRGKVVQRGTHDEMAAVDGPYRTLINA